MSAIMSANGIYRYFLRRSNDEKNIKKELLFCMLNPSTADSFIDDPTIRRCKYFSTREGYDSLAVINLFAFRSSKPKSLRRFPNSIGHKNNSFIRSNLKSHNYTVICAWGNNAPIWRVRQFVEMIKKNNGKMFCLGTTKMGQPRHPLYTRSNEPLLPWSIDKIK